MHGQVLTTPIPNTSEAWKTFFRGLIGMQESITLRVISLRPCLYFYSLLAPSIISLVCHYDFVQCETGRKIRW